MSVWRDKLVSGLEGPPGLSRLMDLYESNYRGLSRLIPLVRQLRGDLVAEGRRGDPDLHVRIREQTTYTTRLELTYLFSGVADPALEVRLFHDARVAEVLSCCGHPRHHALASFSELAGEQITRRWPRNLLLAKWLDYLLATPRPLLQSRSGRGAPGTAR